MKEVLLIVPIYNEEENLEDVIEDLEGYKTQVDVLYINDGSTDSSENILEKYHLFYLKNTKNQGYSYTIQKGIQYAYHCNYTYVIQFDADGQHRAKYIRNLLMVMKEQKADLVIGTRYSMSKVGVCKRIGSRICSIILQRRFHQEILDTTSRISLSQS